MEDLLVKNNISDWTPAVENELMRWSNNSKINKELHNECHSYYRKYYRWLSIPVIVLSTIAGAANFIVNTLLETEQDKTYANVSIGIVNLCVGVISTLMNFFKLAEREQLHKKSAEDYENLSTLIDAKLGLLHEERGDAREFYNLISKEYTRLKTNEVHIKKGVRRRFRKTNKHMVRANAIEFPDSIALVENLYHPTPKYKTNNGAIPVITPTPVLSTSGASHSRTKLRPSSPLDGLHQSTLEKKDTILQDVWKAINPKNLITHKPSTSSIDEFDESSTTSTDESILPPNTPDEPDITTMKNSIIQLQNQILQIATTKLSPIPSSPILQSINNLPEVLQGLSYPPQTTQISGPITNPTSVSALGSADIVSSSMPTMATVLPYENKQDNNHVFIDMPLV